MTEKILKAATLDYLLTQKEVEQITGMSASTLEQWRHKNKGPKWVRFGEKSIRYPKSLLDEYTKSLPVSGA